MNVSEALQTRRSCRAFKAKEVDGDTILTILNDALRAPSWGNTQPWEIWVAGGELLTEINQAFLSNKKDHVPVTSDIPRPVKWTADALEIIIKSKRASYETIEKAKKILNNLNSGFSV